MNTTLLTIAIPAKNADTTLKATLESVKGWAEILVLDDGSTDETKKLAAAYTDSVFSEQIDSFAEKRNFLLKKCRTDWIFYLDTDEVVSDQLREEITAVVAEKKPGAFVVTRANTFLGKQMYNDQMARLFHTSCLTKWVGALHEHPQCSCKIQVLTSPLFHHTHRTIASMLEKTNEWSEVEAELRYKAKHPKMAGWRLGRVALSELWHQFIHLHVGRFGREGLFEGYFQMISMLVTYVKLWEKQHAQKTDI